LSSQGRVPHWGSKHYSLKPLAGGRLLAAPSSRTPPHCQAFSPQSSDLQASGGKALLTLAALFQLLTQYKEVTKVV